MKDNVIFWRDWDDAIRSLPDNEQAEAYRAVMDYAMNDVPYSGSNGAVRMLMQFITPKINEAKVKYDAVCERNRSNGLKGGRPRKTEKPSKTQQNPLGLFDEEKNPQKPDKGYRIKDKGYRIKDNDKDKDIILPIPTIDEVREYVNSKGYDIDVMAFWSYYDAREWMKDGKPIKNWHLQVATWVKNQNRYNNQDYGISKRTRANQRGESPITDWQNVTEDDMQF